MSLKEARKHRGETLAQVAMACGIDPSYLQRIESGFAPKPEVARSVYVYYGGLVHYLDIIDPGFLDEVGLVEITSGELKRPANTCYRVTTRSSERAVTGLTRLRALLRKLRLFEVWKDRI